MRGYSICRQTGYCDMDDDAEDDRDLCPGCGAERGIEACEQDCKVQRG